MVRDAHEEGSHITRKRTRCWGEWGLQGCRSTVGLCYMCMVPTRHIWGSGWNLCKPLWSPHPLTLITRARTQKCQGHTDLSGGFFSRCVLLCHAAPWCWTWTLAEAELSRCWAQRSLAWLWRAVPNCHHSFPSYMWHMAYTVPDGAERRFFFIKPQ